MLVAVTGGARGIGLAIAGAFAKRGAQVVLGDLDLELARSAAAAIGATAYPLDVRDRESFAAFLAAAGPVDVLVNNAGVAPGGPLVGADPAALDCIIDVNLRGAVNGMRLVLPDMVARGSGHIVNIGSVSGRVPLAGAAVYTATKFGLVGLTEAARAEVIGSGVLVSAVLPSFVSTDITAGRKIPALVRASLDGVAAAVVRVVDRGGPPVVMVPRHLGMLTRLAGLVPYRIRDAFNARTEVITTTVRADYDRRVAEQYPGSSPSPSPSSTESPA